MTNYKYYYSPGWDATPLQGYSTPTPPPLQALKPPVHIFIHLGREALQESTTSPQAGHSNPCQTT